ncbi:hypothetical protein Tco_0170035 [Tanacetum coccineum]
MLKSGHDSNVMTRAVYEDVRDGYLKANAKWLTVKSLSATRWESLVESVKALRFQLSNIREALLQVFETDNDSLIKSTS